MSIIPRNVWSWWPEGAIEWLEPFDDDATKALTVKGIADEKLHARLGCIAVWLRYGDQSQRFSVIDSTPFELHAKFLIAESKFRRVVFGMAGNAIDRWKTLEVNSEAREAQFL
ncbi:MAG: hypothetical protein WCJ09_03660 [Planctomycetota bacterium]